MVGEDRGDREVLPSVLIGLLGESAGVGSFSKSLIIALMSTPNSFSLLFCRLPSSADFVGLSIELPPIGISTVVSTIISSGMTGAGTLLGGGEILLVGETVVGS